jgi:hypothetical protein
VDVTVIGWTPGQDTVALKQAICEAIADPNGWDILFFAGHSNEADIVDGVIYVAPKTALSIRELTPALQTAKARGLQFALFNSCSGLNIADALVDLGLSQVAVMREPIHNAVALVFVRQFLQALARHEHVQAALATACRHLKLDQQITYPSAYLIPSLFRHLDSVPFRIEPRSWRHTLRRWLPGRRQAAALAAVAVLSVVPAVRESLLSGRLLAQAMYRNLTGQLPPEEPPVVLVQIDRPSIQRSTLLSDPGPVPINLEYLSQLVNELQIHQVKVVGIDYILDRPRENADVLRQALRQSVASNQTWFVLFSHWDDGEEIGPKAILDRDDFRWSMQGYTDAFKWYLTPPWSETSCFDSCPFAYLLALAATYQNSSGNPEVQPRITNTDPLTRSLFEDVRVKQLNNPDSTKIFSVKSPEISISKLFLWQRWLHPIADFSLPPDSIIHRISAYELLEGLSQEDASFLRDAPVVVIGAVGYSDAQGDGWQETGLPEPLATTYWRNRGQDSDPNRKFSKVEFVSYSIHHFFEDHLVIVLPALWAVGATVILCKGVLMAYSLKNPSRLKVFGLLTAVSLLYGLSTLQIVIWFNLIIPWLLPTAVIWVYWLPYLKHQNHAK